MVDAMVAMAMLAVSLPGSYDCTIERQVVITESGANGSAVSFPEAERAAWGFRATLAGDERSATVDWPANPIQIAGRHLTLPLAPGQVALAAPSEGPCMFTERNCLTIVEFSARAGGDMAFSILPAGSSRDAATDTRTLLHVVFLGTCRRREGG
jgi:hypothetical protein